MSTRSVRKEYIIYSDRWWDKENGNEFILVESNDV